jgi:phosphoglycerate dehydrogenase-like enzyme
MAAAGPGHGPGHGGAALAFAFAPVTIEALFGPAEQAQLARLCRILAAAPLRALDDAAARTVLAKVEILVTGWGCPPIDEVVLAAAPNLRLIAHAAGSVRALVSPAVFARGIAVVTAADANALPVAEYTVAAILFANKRVLDFAARYASERRPLGIYVNTPPTVGNFRRTIGLVGASRIGRRVAQLLRPFDFTVLVADPFLSPAGARDLGVERVELDDLLRRSDVVSLHAPSLPETRHMLDARRLGLLRDGATLINTARGALVDQAALVAELASGRINAVLDVTEPDALAPDSPLYDLPNVLLTPHVAGAAGGELRRFGELITAEIDRFARGEALRHAVDPQTFTTQA